MSRIERAFGAVFGQPAVKRKDSVDKDGSQGQQHRQQREPDEHEHDNEQKPADRQAVEKAITDLRETSDFTRTGMKVEAFETKEGLRVRLVQATGATVKVMSAEEFMKLRDATTSLSPGKILDQKY